MKGLTAAIIPMRGGSKRVPDKNTRLLAGIPLAAYTLKAALAAKRVDLVAVATDDERIEKIAREYGIKQVIRLPPELTGDASPSDKSVVYAIRQLSRKKPVETVVYLQATSPLRTASQIDGAVELFRKGGFDSLLSAWEDGYFYWHERGGKLEASYDYMQRPRSQDVKPKYRENGAIYVTKAKLFLETGCRLGGKIGVYPMDELSTMQVDTAEDFKLMELILKATKR